MYNVNITDRVIIIESDPVKLDAAIRTALAEAQKVMKETYFPGFNKYRAVGDRPSRGKVADNKLNAAHVVCHYLIPPKDFSFLGSYVSQLDEVLNIQNQKPFSIKLLSSLAFGDAEKVDAWTKNSAYARMLRHACRFALCSLLRQGAVLLPAKYGVYLPVTKSDGGHAGLDLLPDRVLHMLAIYGAADDLAEWDTRNKRPLTDFGADWSVCTYSGRGKTIAKDGIERCPQKMVKGYMVNVAMCTRWESILDVEEADIPELESLYKLGTISLYLTYLFLKASKDEQGECEKTMWEWIARTRFLKIYTSEFDKYSDRAKGRRYGKRKTAKGTGAKNYEAKAKRLGKAVDKRTIAERVQDVAAGATANGGLDSYALARSLGSMYLRTSIGPLRWPSEEILGGGLDKHLEASQWKEAFKQYARMRIYADDSTYNPLVPFVHYLLIYLPIYFDLHPDSDAQYPKRIEHLNGFHFISRPTELELNLPLTFDVFVGEYYAEVDHSNVYRAIQNLHLFFKTVLGRREVVGIPEGFENPVLETDIPNTGGRPSKSTKTRLPRKVYWLALLYCYKIYDYVSLINEKCLEDPEFGEHVNDVYVDRGEDLSYGFDIREIDGIDFDRTMIFDGVEHEVNLVPAYFFHPVTLPLKGKGNHLLLKPHSLVHNIVALETGIRHNHIQWLSYDFDKLVLAENLIPEDVYKLFVKTDKSNKSWEALTSGRVIKILREMRIFRDLVDNKTFDEKLYYEGRVETAVYSPFKVLFAFNKKTGNPYNDGVYEWAFVQILYGLQRVLDHYGVDYSLYKYKETGDARASIKTDISPHSTRVTVVSELTQNLSSEYVGRYITNQKRATIWHYTKFEAEQLRQMEEEQGRHQSTIDRNASKVTLLGNGGEMIDATSDNSPLAVAFKEDPHQAILDFGAVSTHYFDRETGISIITSNTNNTLALEPSYICPFNRICPADRHKDGMANRCNMCDYNVRTVDHLPAISSKIRDLVGELGKLELFLEKPKLTETVERDAEARLSVIGEDLGSLAWIEQCLRTNLQCLLDGEEAGVVHIYEPEAVLKKLQARPFPDEEKDEVKFLIARAKEVQAYPDPAQDNLKAKFAYLKMNILANTGGIREALAAGCNVDNVEAEIWSLITSLGRVHGKTLDQVFEIANRDIVDMLGIETQNVTEIPTTLNCISAPDGTGTDG